MGAVEFALELAVLVASFRTREFLHSIFLSAIVLLDL